MSRKITVHNTFRHLRTVRRHRKWVRKYCFKCGLIWQGLIHDLSKYNPIEFWESVRYYEGKRSPIDACKEENGISYAWLHHRGRNPHHWEYWTDNYSSGTSPQPIPYKYRVEMICDYLGAGRAYMGKKFTYTGEFKWWLGREEQCVMLPENKKFIHEVLSALATLESVGVSKPEKCLQDIIYKFDF